MKYVLIFFCMGWALSAYAQSLKDAARSAGNNFNDIAKAAEAYFGHKFEASGGSPQYRLKPYSADSGMMVYEKIDGEYAKYKRWEWYWKDRVLPDGSFPDLASINRKIQAHRDARKTRAAEPQWACINQTTCTGGYNGMGRAKAVAFHPSNKEVFYVGAPIGGVWKTSDGGLTYKPISDQLPYVSAGCVVVDPDSEGTLYISVSDNGGWWNYSLGIYKTVNDGQSWEPTGLTWDFSDGVAIYNLVMNPGNSKELLAATSKGLWKTSNGGLNWTKVLSTACNDVAYRPGDGNTVYAVTDDYWNSSEVYRSVDAGNTWNKISSFKVEKNSLKIAVTPANPDMLAVRHSVDKRFFVSKDRGSSFAEKPKIEDTGILFISPNDENTMYCGFVNALQSTDGGNSWKQISMWYGGTQWPEVHADFQYVASNPLNGLFYFCNDGGVYSYNEKTAEWKELTDGLVITQYYRIAVSQTNPVKLIGGTQDNGGRMRNADGSWSATNGGDAMEVAIDPLDDNISYSTYCNGELFRTTNNWRRNTKISSNIPGEPTGEWVTPYQLDPNNPAVIVAGYDQVYRSEDRGDTWVQLGTTGIGTIQVLEVAPSNSKVICVSRDNNLRLTTDLGVSWQRITTPSSGENIKDIVFHPADENKMWLTYGGYRDGNKVYYSSDQGASWENISGSLPNVPVSAIVYEKGSKDRLYVGTDAGVYFKEEGMFDWALHGEGLPFTSVMDLEIQEASKMLRAGTHGRGVWEVPLRNVQVNELPVVSIIAPESGYQLDGGALRIVAEATDVDGVVTKVQFFVNGQNVGVDSVAPYSIEIQAVPSGDLVLMARAYDDSYGMAVSEAVSASAPCYSEYIAKGDVIGTEGSWGNSGNDKFKVFDGDVESFFDAPEGDGAWAGLDLGLARELIGFRLYPRDGFADRLIGGSIEVSNNADFSESKTVFSVAEMSQLAWHCYYVALDEKYRYVRYMSADGGHNNVAEFECILAPRDLPAAEGEGLQALYFSEPEMQNVAEMKIDEQIKFNGTLQDYVGHTGSFSALWQGMLSAPVSGDYLFSLATDSGIKLWIDDSLLVNEQENMADTTYTAYLHLTAGELYPIRVEYLSADDNFTLDLQWAPEGYENRTIEIGFFSPLVQQTIDFHSGWNLISFYTLPDDKSVQSVLKNVAFREIKTVESYYNTSMPEVFRSLKEVETGKGYAIYIEEGKETSLKVVGNISNNNAISLQPGWNIIGVNSYRISVNNIGEALEIKNFQESWTKNGLGNLEFLEPGQAYYVKQ